MLKANMPGQKHHSEFKCEISLEIGVVLSSWDREAYFRESLISPDTEYSLYIRFYVRCWEQSSDQDRHSSCCIIG
jgi:hypothetical protein